MPQQFTFDGFDTPVPAVRNDNLFFAIRPDAPSIRIITSLAANLRTASGLTGPLRKPDILHLTLCHIDNFDGLPADVVDRAKETAAKVKARSFEITLDRAVSFRGSRAYVLLAKEGSAALKAFRQQLFVALKTDGPACQATASFTPHVTMLYDDHLVAEQPIEPVSWKAGEFVLVHSPFGQTKHNLLGRWSLTD